MRAALITAIGLATFAGAARAEHAVLVSRPASAAEIPHGATAQVKFRAVMDSVFGAGKWRETGGYRTPEREAQLRAEGALTVRPGAISQHSRGRPDAPGAYDAVVAGLPLDAAAEKLRRSGAPFRKIFAEGAHGTQGAHLHLEPVSLDFSGVASIAAAGPVWTVADVTPADQALGRLRAAAAAGDATSQLRLGAAYAEGRVAPRDLVTAYVWAAMAGANPGSDTALKRDSDQILAMLSEHMAAADIDRARRFARPQVCEAAHAADASPVVLLTGAIQAHASNACSPSGG